MLVIDESSTGYGRVQVLNRVSLSVATGEVLAVIGPNGAGKSTLMRLICGALLPWEGDVVVDGNSVAALPVERRAEAGIVLCPEGRRIFTTLSIEENLKLGAEPLRARNTGSFQASMRDGLERAYSMFPILRERRHSSGGALSGGQQQMLAIARALMSDPQLLLLDEPSLGLSPVIANEVYATLAELKRQGLTIIVVEEAAGRPLTLADKAIVVRGGVIVRSGSSAEIAASESDLASAYLGKSSE